MHEWNYVNSGYALSYQEEKFGVLSQYFREYATLQIWQKYLSYIQNEHIVLSCLVMTLHSIYISVKRHLHIIKYGIGNILPWNGKRVPAKKSPTLIYPFWMVTVYVTTKTGIALRKSILCFHFCNKLFNQQDTSA